MPTTEVPACALIYKFTGKERDSESGLDEFGARYYSSSIGRFMIPDWAAAPTAVPYAHYGNPQSLNLYSYVENNPTTMGDPDGHECPECTGAPILVTPDEAIGAVKGLWNMVAGTWNTAAQLLNDQGAASGQTHIELQMLPTATYDNATQAVSGGVAQLGAVVAGGIEGAARGEAAETGATVPDANVVVRGGQGEIPATGTYSGAHGTTLEEAASGVPHGTIRTSTAGAIKDSGGTVTPKPEPAYPGGPINQRHADITGGQKTFGPPRQNPVPRSQRVPSAPKIKKPNEPQ
jgi:RHS repeat-associated protein